jgi:hypothetical protein
MSLIPLWAKALIVAAILAACAWAVNAFLNYERNIGYQKAVAEYNVKLVAAQTKAAEDTARLAKEKDNAIADATQKLKAREAAAAKLTIANSGLRDTITNLGNSLSTTTLNACRARAAALSTVFGQCTERLVEMGHAAQGQLIDSLMYQNAWPK